jgi:hypothetical protein
MTSERRGRRLLKGGGDDEDIPTTTTTSPTLHDEQANQIRLGPITRARAKLLEQQVNLLLLESDDRLSENYILPKSLCICMIRYQAGDKELGGAEVQEGEAKEQGQATLEEEPQEAKAKKIQASGRGTTALAAVLPRHGTTASTTASTTAGNREIYGSSRGTRSVLPPLLPRATERFTVVGHGTTAPR